MNINKISFKARKTLKNVFVAKYCSDKRQDLVVSTFTSFLDFVQIGKNGHYASIRGLLKHTVSKNPEERISVISSLLSSRQPCNVLRHSFFALKIMQALLLANKAVWYIRNLLQTKRQSEILT